MHVRNLGGTPTSVHNTRSPLSELSIGIIFNTQSKELGFFYTQSEERVDFIVYKPEGMRGKRAYIKTDGENYLAWSGPIDKKHKSAFLRGDFEKAEEESPVQEKENVEVKQEKESETSDANMSISERLEKLTKLYEEGELTEEEYKQKTNELIS